MQKLSYTISICSVLNSIAASRGIALPQTLRLLLPPPRVLGRRRRGSASAASAEPGGHGGLSGEGALEGDQLGLPVSRRQQVRKGVEYTLQKLRVG